MKITARVGGKTKEKQVKPGGPIGNFKDLTDFYVQEMTKKVTDRTFPFTVGRLNRLAKSMEKAGNTELQKMIPTMVQNLMGRTSTSTTLTLNPSMLTRGAALTSVGGLRIRNSPLTGAPSGSIQWQPLSQRWMQQKKNKKYFIGTGQLQQYFMAHADEIVLGRFGGVHVNFDVNKTELLRTNRALSEGETRKRLKVVLGFLRVQMLPAISASSLPFKRTGNWTDINPNAGLEYRFFGPYYARKLKGPENKPDIHRPLMQPVLGFWMAYRLPAALASALNSVVSRVKGTSDTGTFFDTSGG